MLGMLGTGTLLSVAMILPHALPLAGAMALYACGMGIAVPSSAAGALARHPEAAGSAAALIGGMQIGIGALGSMVGSLVQPYGAPGLALVVLMGSIAATACLLGINGIKSDHPTLAQRHDVATAHIGG